MTTIDIKDVKKGMTVQVWNANAELYWTVEVVKVGKNKAQGQYFIYREDTTWTQGTYTENNAKKHAVLAA